MKFYKDSTTGKWILGTREGVPAGICLYNYDSATTLIAIEYASDRTIFARLPYSEFLKENGTSYASKAEFDLATADFFVKPAGGIESGQEVIDALGFTPEDSSKKGVANGYASLDSSKKVPVAQLPSALAVGAIEQTMSQSTDKAPSSLLHLKTCLPISDLAYVNRAKHGFVNGYIAQDGNIDNNVGWEHTVLLPIENVVVLGGSMAGNYLGAVYDVNGNYLSYITSNANVTGGIAMSLSSIANAVYYSLNIPVSNVNSVLILSQSDYNLYGITSSNYSKYRLKTQMYEYHASTPLYNINMRGNNTFVGAVNNFMDAILALKPTAKFAFIGHYSIDGINGDSSLSRLISAQRKISEYWGSKFIPLDDKLMLIKKTSPNINLLLANIPDQIHPASNLSLISSMASIIASEIKPLLQDWNAKKIRWIGTSIPTGYTAPVGATALESQYPLQVAQILGCTCVNSSVSGSIMRVTKTNGDAISGNYSFMSHVSEFTSLIGTANEPNIWVVDIGYNDFNFDPTDFDV